MNILTFLILSFFVVCGANLPGLPFLQRAFLKKRPLSKRFTEEEAEKANAELQRRIQQECYPSAMSCSMNCLNEYSTCSECEHQMSKCVHKITGEIYAAHNMVYPYGKRRSTQRHIAQGLAEAKKSSMHHPQINEQKLQQRIMNECQKPAVEKYYQCLGNGESDASCSSKIEPFVIKCSKGIVKEEYADLGYVLPEMKKKSISQADLDKVQQITMQRINTECQAPIVEAYHICSSSDKSIDVCESEAEVQIMKCSQRISQEEFAKLGLTIKRSEKRHPSQQALKEAQQNIQSRSMMECVKPAQEAAMGCQHNASPSKCAVKVQDEALACISRITREEYEKLGISVPMKKKGYRREISQSDIDKASKKATERAKSECAVVVQKGIKDCEENGKNEIECSDELESLVVECANKITHEEFDKIGIDIGNLNKRGEISHEAQVSLIQEIQSKCGPSSEACFQSCHDFACVDMCQLKLTTCSSKIYQKYGIEMIDKKKRSSLRI